MPVAELLTPNQRPKYSPPSFIRTGGILRALRKKLRIGERNAIHPYNKVRTAKKIREEMCVKVRLCADLPPVFVMVFPLPYDLNS